MTDLFLTTGIPGWLQPPKRNDEPPFAEYTWDQLMEHMMGGGTLRSFCRERGTPNEAALRKWIHADPQRLETFYDAEAIGADKVADELIDISDGVMDDHGLPSDVQRDTLRVSTRKWLLGIKNRNRYGERKQVDVGVTVDISDAMEKAQQRVNHARQPKMIEGEVIYGDSE